MLGDAVEARIVSDEYLGTALVGIVLKSDDWDTRLAVLARADDVRQMFIDELVLDFVFQDRGEDVAADAPAALTEDAVREYA